MDEVFIRVARRRRRGQSGFTLIELLVVIAVLAVLAAIVIFNVAGVANKGQVAACQTDLRSVQTAVDEYYNDNNQTYPTSGGGVDLNALVSHHYLHSVPTDIGTTTLDASSGNVTSSAC